MNSSQILNFDENKDANLFNILFNPLELEMNLIPFNPNIEENNRIEDEDFIYISEDTGKNKIEDALFSDTENHLEISKNSDDLFSSENINSIMEEFDDINTNNFKSMTKKLNLDESNKISILEKNSFLNKKNEKEKIFNIIHEEKNDIDFSVLKKVKVSIGNKRQRPKKIYQGIKYMDAYNIKNKLLTHFFNQYIFESNNSKIKNAGIGLFIDKFPRKFILSLIPQEQQKKNFQLTLEEIYKKSNHQPNLNVLKQLRSDKYKNSMKQSGFEKRLEMKISDLYQEFLNSIKFGDDIKEYEETIGNDYVVKYLSIAKNL